MTKLMTAERLVSSNVLEGRSFYAHSIDRGKPGYLVRLQDLKATMGVAAGAPILGSHDFFEGDMVQLSSAATLIPVSFDKMPDDGFKLCLAQINIGKQLFDAALEASLSMMSEFGRVIPTLSVRLNIKSHAATFLLFEERPKPNHDYFVIKLESVE